MGVRIRNQRGGAQIRGGHAGCMPYTVSVEERNGMEGSMFWTEAACARQKCGSREQKLRFRDKPAIARFLEK